MRILASHKFTNAERKEIRILQLAPADVAELQLQTGDQIAIETIDGVRTHRTYLRPDECLVLIKLLSQGVYLASAGYYLDNGKSTKRRPPIVERKRKSETTGGPKRI